MHDGQCSRSVLAIAGILQLCALFRSWGHCREVGPVVFPASMSLTSDTSKFRAGEFCQRNCADSVRPCLCCPYIVIAWITWNSNALQSTLEHNEFRALP